MDARFEKLRDKLAPTAQQHVLRFWEALDADERLAYTSCLAGVADDAATPLRVVISMRSDFIDRVAEDRTVRRRMFRLRVALYRLPFQT